MDFFVVIVGRNGFTDCSTMSLKAFNLRRYFAANHNGGHPVSCFILSSSCIESESLCGDCASVLLTISVLWTPPFKQHNSSLITNSQTECTVPPLLKALSAFYFNYEFISSLKGFFASWPLCEAGVSGRNIFNRLQLGFFSTTRD